ncbi:MAG: AbrB family transcriptional regulator [Pseudomonadota bacterium]
MTATDRIGASVLTLAIGAGGAALFWLIGFPAAPLTGPATAVTLATVLGLPLRVPGPIRDLCFLTLGIGIGASVTPEVLQTALTWPLSLALLSLALYLSILAAQRTLISRFQFDRITALLSATPGHLSYMIGLSTDLKSDVSRVAIVQSVRVLMLTLLVPIILTIWGVEGGAVLAKYGRQSWPLIFATFVVSALVGFCFQRLRIPAAFLLAGMAVSAVGHATNLTPGTLPPWLTIAAFVVMGSLIGTRFSGLTWPQIRASLWAGVVVTLIACAIAAVAAFVAAEILGLSPAVLMLAFAPGGVEVMAAMAVQTGLEPAFVAAHHVLRLLVLTFLIPVLLRAERSRPAASDDP